jgi:localization factor PodJL
MLFDPDETLAHLPAQPSAGEGNPRSPEALLENVPLNGPHPTILRLQEAAELGNSEAQFRLGEAYETGQLVDQDTGWAARWYGRAAYQGHGEAQYRYALFKMGDRSVQQDVAESYRWLLLAAKQGHQKAQETGVDLELSLGIDLLYQQKAWVDAFKPSAEVFLSDPPTVEYLQAKLSGLGLDPGPADGSIGPRTKAALLAYQTEQGLEATGAPSPALLEKIRAEDRLGNVQAASSAGKPVARNNRYWLY